VAKHAPAERASSTSVSQRKDFYWLAAGYADGGICILLEKDGEKKGEEEETIKKLEIEK
jgi:hypothetical protein